MTALTHDGCPDIKVTPLPAGGMVLTGPSMTQAEHPAELQQAIDLPRPDDARLVVLLEEKPFAPIAQQFFDGQAFRHQLVLVPARLTEDPEAEALAVRYAEFYQLQVQVPVGRIGPPGEDGRFVPVDDRGRETGWAEATAVRVLPAAHVAAREAIRVALDIAAGPEPDPARRLRDLLGRLAGRPVPRAALAAAVHLVRHGVPEGLDPAELTASAMPVSAARLWRLVGGEPDRAATAEVLETLRARPGSAALLSYRPFHAAPRQIAWLTAEGDRLSWIEPTPEGLAVPFDPDHDARRRADLSDPDTRVLLVDAPPGPAPSSTLPGLYADIPDLLDEVDSIDDVEGLVRDLAASVHAAITRRMQGRWQHAIPGMPLTGIDLSEIGEALRTDPQSFFPDGRSFEVRDGTFHWHRVTITPVRDDAHAEQVPQTEDNAKYDTRLDTALGEKSVATVGVSGSLGIGASVPGRIGPGGAVAVEGVLSRPLESVESSSKLTGSHNIRSGGYSSLVSAPTRFDVTVTDARGPLDAPDAVAGTPVTATVHYRAVDDIAGIATGEQQEFRIGADRTSLLAENFTPLRILRAGFADENVDDWDHLTGWHDLQEQLINRLRPTRAVDPGTLGASNLRDLLDRRSFLGLLIPALDGGAHPPTLRSRHGAHALDLELTAEVPEGLPVGDIKKSSFRTQPGLSSTRKVTHASRVGGGLSVVPLRWGFVGGYVQFRVFGGFVRTMTASASSSSQSRTGTEFKDVPDTLVALRFDVTLIPALRELPLTRSGSAGATGPITLHLVVVGHLPTAKLRQLDPRIARDSIEPPAGGQVWHPPPYALTGGRSVTQGLSQFLQFSADVQALVRRFEGGFLPRFHEPARVRHLYSSRAALERQQNQSALDRVLTPAGRRQGQGSGLKKGQIVELTRTKKWGTRHLVIHVRERYTKPFTYRGVEKGVAVRTARADGDQHKVMAGRQVRLGAAFEGGAILRLLGRATAALSLGGSLEGRLRFARRGGAKRAGQEVRLNGGTPNSAVFGNDLEMTVDVYAYTRHFGRDKQARAGFGRVYRQRLPRPSRGPATRVITTSQVPGPSGQRMTRFRMVETKPVTVLFDQSSVLAKAIDAPAVFEERPDPLGVHRRAQVPLSGMRDWVDGTGTSRVKVKDWLSVEAFPGGAHFIDLAEGAITDAQRYGPGDLSRTKLHGLRGVDSLLAGMPVWAGLIGELGDEVQAATVRAMLSGHWQFDKLTPGDHGAATDLAMSASLFNAEVLAAYGTLTTETATIGSVERDGVRTTEQQLAARAVGGVNVRKPGNFETNRSGGGVQLAAAFERLLWARSAQTGQTVFSAIERNRNNRKAKVRSYLVKFDMRMSAAVELTTEPDRYRWWPHSLRTGSWLHHFKWAQRDGTVRNAIYLRLSAEVVDKLGLLDKLGGDSGTVGAPWKPAGQPQVRLTDGTSFGSGIWNPRDAPDLSDRVARELARIAKNPPPGTSWTEALTGAVKFWDAAAQAGAKKARAEARTARAEIRTAATLSKSLTADGLHDPMLNRRRLQYLAGAEGITRHLPSMADGGADVLHLKPGRLTQHPRDIRLIATPIGPPRLDGFLADHDDLDIKFTSGAEASRKVQKAHGHSVTAGVSGSGISNQHGENFASGLGDAVGYTSHVSNASTTGSGTLRSDLSSGRGIKARLTTPTRFSLVVFDKGRQVGDPLLTIDDEVTQDRWADDLHLARPRGTTIGAPAHYRVARPPKLPPGWALVNGMPVPSRFVPEDLTQVAAIQATVTAMLEGEARRLSKAGYAPTHLIHESITPELLLPGVPKMLTPEGLDLPAVTSTQIFGQKMGVNIRLLPESASLGSISSGLFREHVHQNSGGVSASTNQRDQASRLPRVLLGRGYAEDAGQGVGVGGPGAVSGDAYILDDAQNVTGGSLGNVKPESRSAAVDYLSRVVVTLNLPKHLWKTFGGPRLVISPDTAQRTMVRLRMGLHDARIAMHLPAEADQAGREWPGRVAAFAAVVEQEARLAKAADAFTTAAEALDEARYAGHAAKDDPAARAAVEARLPGLLEAWDTAGRAWWDLAQEHYRLVDEFRHAYIGVSAAVKDPSGPGKLLRQISADATAREPDAVPPPPVKDPLPPPPPAPPATPAGTLRVPVPGDGRCQLYSTVTAAPRLVGERLAAAGLDDPALLTWLADPVQVRTDVAAMMAGYTGPIPGLAASPLGRAADQLRQLVGRFLAEVGADGMPAQAFEAFRNNSILAVQNHAAGRNRAQLLRDLTELGITTAGDPQAVPMATMRRRYLAMRTTQLTQAGLTPANAAATAAAEVPLKSPTDLADDAPSMRTMFDRLRLAGVTIPLSDLPDAALRDLFTGEYLRADRTPNDLEFAAIVDAVDNWEDHWNGPLGETFMPLLAAALDTRVLIRQTGMPAQEIGPAAPRTIEVFRTGDHYDAGVRPDLTASLEDPADDKTVGDKSGGGPAALDHEAGRAVLPKVVKPFEADPPRAPLSGDKGTKAKEIAKTPGGFEVRLNPAWIPLEDFTPEVYAGRREAHWHYVTMPDGRIYLGSEEILTALSDGEVLDHYLGVRATNPGQLMRDLRDGMNQQGHPTIAVRFESAVEPAVLGPVGEPPEMVEHQRAYVSEARISGELSRNPVTGELEANDKSGRYMSEKVRPDLDPEQVKKWLTTVAERIAKQVGEPVRGVPFKHAADRVRVTAPEPEGIARDLARARDWASMLDPYLELVRQRLAAITAEADVARADVAAARSALTTFDTQPGDPAARQRLADELTLAEAADRQAQQWLDTYRSAGEALRAESAAATAEIDRLTGAMRGQVIDALKTPGAAREVDGILVIGDEAAWAGREVALRAMLAAAKTAGGPAILINGDALARAEREERAASERAARARVAQRENLPADVSNGTPLATELRALGTALRQYAGADLRPVVYTTAAADGLTALLENYRAVSVTGVSHELGTAWQATGPLGAAPGAPLALGVQVTADAASRLVPLGVPEMPATLATWLRSGDWAAASAYLTGNLKDLLKREVSAALDRLVWAEPGNRELRAYQVVLQLARTEDDAASFALDYLGTQADEKQRNEWNNRLLDRMAGRQISATQAEALAEGRLVRDGPAPAPGSRGVDSGRADGMLFRAVGLLLSIPPERAGDLTGESYREALALVQGCVITATDKWMWLLRLKDLEAKLTTDSAALLRVFSDKLANNC